MKLQTNKVFRYLKNSKKRITSMRGGTRSGKTYNILIFLVFCALDMQGKTITVARQTMPALRASAMRDFFEILSSIDLYREANHNKTSNEYVLNGNIFEFIGVKESERVRGRKRDILFFNEANEGELESFRQLAFRTKDKIILDYNPSDTHSWIYEQVETRSDCELFVTTYKDNPFLEKSIVEEIELLKESDLDYWKVYGLGEIANISNIIFTHWKIVSADAYPYGKGESSYGLDFGYNNATAITETKLYDNKLFWRELLYQTKLTNADLIEKLKEIPEIAGGGLIVADSAEPQRIEEIERAGFAIIGANKSVKDGIDFVKSKPFYIHETSSNLLREVKRYAWKTDKTGRVLDEVIKFDDHACFIAGTEIETITGKKRIEQIQENDLVLTRKGYKRVLKASKTSDCADVMAVVLSNGQTLTGTPNHPIWIRQNGFVRLDAVRYNDWLESQFLWKSLYSNQTIQTLKSTDSVFVKKILIETNKKPVFNLTVEDAEEYFANGILVHNCDAGRYGSMKLHEPVMPEVRPVQTVQYTHF